MTTGLFPAIRQTGLHLPEEPIRAELFSVERLEQHAESLAAAQPVAPHPKRGRPLARRLRDNTRVLTETYRAVLRATAARQPITPAAEWLLDNFHVVDEQIRQIRSDLPPGFYRWLPKLSAGPLLGYPRVFGVAWALVAHTDSAFDLHRLTHFVESYQRVQPLTIGELWALAITLRITLVENLRRLAESIAAQQTASQMADGFADQILAAGEGSSDPDSPLLHSLRRAPWSTAFAVRLAQRLRDRDPNVTPALRWLNERLAAAGTTTDRMVREEFQRQSATDVTARNVIMSMRLISMINWAEFFESVSPVDAVLRGADGFVAMDFPTRDLYRRAIESLARGSGHSEVAVAERAIAAVRGASDQTADEDVTALRKGDPGYFLLAEGRPAFERELGARVPLRTRLFRLNSALGVTSYVGMIVMLTLVTLALPLLAVAYVGIDGWRLLILAIVGIVPASDVAVAVVNRVVTKQVRAVPLPGLELRQGIPPSLRTIVVVPTLLVAGSALEEQIERLEVHHLSNPDDNFLFALLSDWQDAPTERSAADTSLLDEAAAGIARLNARYGPAGNCERFFLLHRRRLWNEGEGMWIGWERKRGKLHELNRLLRGATDTSFMPIDGHTPALPSGIRYVITLDADTRLPMGTARRLVGKIAHPLNQPCFDRRAGLVVRGHGVLQPRVTPSLPIGSRGSLFQRTFSGPNGLDPYALAASDVYQDLFGEGSYCGKGIYDIDSFEAALEGQIPENSVLSHDLLEGIFARAGLASDIEVVEEFPTRYAVAAARQHRWVRGDWQLLPWIFGFRLRAADGSRKTSIPLMGRWKLLDNLRRSLSAPAALLAFLIGWLQPVPVAAIWTAYIALTIALPPLLPAITGVVPHRGGVSFRNHLRSLRGDFALGLMQSAFLITFLAHQAWLMVDAVVRTLFRLFIRRSHLLEWVTAAPSDDDSRFDQRGLPMQVTASLACAALVALAFAALGQRSWPIAVPFVALWVLSPLAGRWASRPPPEAGHLSVTPADALALRLVARRTWSFFDRFVTAADHMLPPDNFQEGPRARDRPPHLSDQHRTLSAFSDCGARFRLARNARRHRTTGGNLRNNGEAGPVPRPFLQLVRHGRPACARAALCLLGRQWQSGRPSHRARKCLPRDFRGLGRHAELAIGARRHPGPRPRRRGAAYAGAGPTERRGGVVASGNRCFRRGTGNRSVKAAGHRAAPGGSNAYGRRSGDCCARDPHERDAAQRTDIVVWAEALLSSALAHQHDFDLLVPWAGLLGAETVVDADTAALLETMPTLAALPGHSAALSRLLANRPCSATHEGRSRLLEALEKSVGAGQSVTLRLAALANLTETFFKTMEFGFLFDPERQLLSIGYRGGDGSLDANFYDLLASEARLASFVAIAKGDVPAKHWFRLGRTLTGINGRSLLISWSGSMFEYLMPSLVMRAPASSLLAQTNRLAVWRQENYGAGLGVPWGMSESEYNARDIEQNYQYSSFGVPDLGYKRGLAESIVIAPYATGLAAMVDPAAAASNFRRLASHRRVRRLRLV